MKYADEFRDPKLARTLVAQIDGLLSDSGTSRDRPVQIMEFCGGHTHTIFRYGLEQMLPDTLELVHGPGCPVCVLPMGRVDDCVALAQWPGVIFTTFGDAMRVPGSKRSLLKAKAEGADIRMVYSPLDALALARKFPDREVVFFALGFETTMPSTALPCSRPSGKASRTSHCSATTSPPYPRSRPSSTRPTCRSTVSSPPGT